MTFCIGTHFSYSGRTFKVLSKWIKKGDEHNYDIEFIESDAEEVKEVLVRKLGYLQKLENNGLIKYLKHSFS